MRKYLVFMCLLSFLLAGKAYSRRAVNRGSNKKYEADVQHERSEDEERDRNVDHPVHKWFEAAKKEPLFNKKFTKGISGREEWWANGQDALRKAIEKQNLNQNVAKNVIIFIGDGMGISTVSAARIYEGYEREDGAPGEQNFLSFEKFPYSGLAKTYNSDWQVPDSAGTATAILCGIKSRFNMVGLDDSATQFLCETQDGAEVRSILYWAEDAGKSTGVVTNTGITHATPASAYANSVSRNYECDADIILPGLNPGCKDIAAQLIDQGHDIEVAMGGARSNFLPVTTKDPVDEGRTGNRKDGRNLIEDWKNDKLNKGASHEVVYTAQELEAVNAAQTDYLFGLFARGHMSYHRERPENQPSLSDMTRKAIEILQKNDNGFFLLVEGGRIDMGHHGSRAKRALTDTIEFSRTVETAVNMTSEDDTLIIVTADHSHVFNFAGYHAIGTDILGKGIYPAEDLQPYTKLLYGNGPGYKVDDTDCNRDNIREVDTTDNGYVFQSSAPLGSETHGGEDVAIYSRGPMAHLLQGVQEQHYIAHAAAYAACIGENQDHCAGAKHHTGAIHQAAAGAVPYAGSVHYANSATKVLYHWLLLILLAVIALYSGK